MKGKTSKTDPPTPLARPRIGYARVSTDDQNLDLQLDALQASGSRSQDIYQEKLSGSKADRLELDHAIKALRSGDVWRFGAWTVLAARCLTWCGSLPILKIKASASRA